MPVATVRSIALTGAVGHLVDVQVDVSQGMVATALVGRPDASVSEGRDRCRSAVANAGFTWPATRRVTVLLSPSDIPKRGSHFDLAMAVGVLAASGQVPDESLDRTVMVGELTLDGRLRPVPGVLPMTLAASARGIERIFVPEPQAREAALVPGMSVFGFRSLAQVAAELRGTEVPDAPPVVALTSGALLTWRGEDRLSDLDLVDMVGMADAKFALEVAAAGGHHLLLDGPPGSGKTSLAERLPGILPDLTVEEALELTAVHSLAGVLDAGDGLLSRPPFLAPHHTSSRTSLLGGGTGKVRPGELSRAHCGVLLLDEFPLFASDILDALRQPLEAGEVTIARGEETATYPARGDVRAGLQPVSVRRLHRDPDLRRMHVPGGAAARIPPKAYRPGYRPDRHRPPGPTGARARGKGPLAAARVVLGRPGPGDRGAAFRQQQRYAGASVAAQRPTSRAGAPRGVAPDRAGGGAARRPRCTPAGSPAAVPPGCTGWPGRWPISAGCHSRGRRAGRGAAPAVRRAAGAGRARATARVVNAPSRVPPRAARPTEGERLARLALGRLGEPGDPRLASLVAELGAERVHRHLSEERDLGGMLTDVACQVAWSSTRRETWTGPSASASGSWCPATRSGRRALRTSTTSARSRTGAAVPWGSGCAGRLRLR